MQYICGVDEAGRGPWAGEVVAAAVILNQEQPIAGLKDSKQLTESKREVLYGQIIEKALSYSIASASVAEIDSLNILQATLLAMQRAVEGLDILPAIALVDGNKIPKLSIPAKAIIKGDSKVQEISAASILAKVARDRMMLEMDKLYPQYGFAKHKGYGTAEPMKALQQYGPCAVHRQSFEPIKSWGTTHHE